MSRVSARKCSSKRRVTSPMVTDHVTPVLDWQCVYSSPIVRLVGTVHRSLGHFGIELEGGSILNMTPPHRDYPTNDSTGTASAYPYGSCESEDVVPAREYVGKRLKNLIYSISRTDQENRQYYAVLENGGFLAVDLVFIWESGFAFAPSSEWNRMRSVRFFNAWNHSEIRPSSVYR